MWLNLQGFRWAVWLIPSRLVLADDNWLLRCCVSRYHKGLILCNGNIAILFCLLFPYMISGFHHGVNEVSLLWDVMQCWLVLHCRHFSTTHRSHCQGSLTINLCCITSQKTEDIIISLLYILCFFLVMCSVRPGITRAQLPKHQMSSFGN